MAEEKKFRHLGMYGREGAPGRAITLAEARLDNRILAVLFRYGRLQEGILASRMVLKTGSEPFQEALSRLIGWKMIDRSAPRFGSSSLVIELAPTGKAWALEVVSQAQIAEQDAVVAEKKERLAAEHQG
jgi:hypothetical protein